jgi:S1-C subfamily serine protease
MDVVPDSPAARAGLLPDDVVLQVDGASFEREHVGAQAFVGIVSRLSIDRPAMFIIRRGEKRLAIWVKLEPK